jgi:hypothetical protein|tara:strand:- start:217 stop:408 length:192 start_codon:yes stop_codon:yes gene_type:complete
MQFKNDKEAVVNGLVLAVTAPTDAKSDQALALVKQISSNMDELTLASCKREAEKILAELDNGS